LAEKWPANLIDVAEVDRLRLFSSGKELEESRTLNGLLFFILYSYFLLDLSYLASQTGFAPVHVTVVSKAARQAAADAAREQSKQSVGCQCTLM
jgi:hypothetical protein